MKAVRVQFGNHPNIVDSTFVQVITLEPALETFLNWNHGNPFLLESGVSFFSFHGIEIFNSVQEVYSDFHKNEFVIMIDSESLKVYSNSVEAGVRASLIQIIKESDTNVFFKVLNSIGDCRLEKDIELREKKFGKKFKCFYRFVQ
jgi:hypothetical protein